VLSTIICCLEADRLYLKEASWQTVELQNHYSGHLGDAQCTNPEDGENIRRELSDSGNEDMVDQAVAVLIRMGMSTPDLQKTAERVGALGNASRWSSFAIAWFFGYLWMTVPIEQMQIGGCGGLAGWSLWLMVVEGLMWATIFLRAPTDSKAFVAKSLQLFFPVFWFICIEKIVFKSICKSYICASVFVCPLIVVVSAVGPANISRVPLVGPVLVRMLLGVKRPGVIHGFRQALRKKSGETNVLSSAEGTAQAPADVMGAKVEDEDLVYISVGQMETFCI